MVQPLGTSGHVTLEVTPVDGDRFGGGTGFSFAGFPFRVYFRRRHEGVFDAAIRQPIRPCCPCWGRSARSIPGVPFLALGQTALWDEPTKAVWRRLLDAHLPGAKFVAGVHDTDYFAKTTAHLGDDQPYVMLPHDDGRTRDLWSAAGELSSLFGSESVPTRQVLRQHNVPFDWLAQGYPGGKDGLYADATTAWGWRGIVSTESHNVVARDVPTTQIGPALLEQLDWGFAESLACLSDPETRAAGERTAAAIRGWVTEFLETCSDDLSAGRPVPDPAAEAVRTAPGRTARRF